MITGIHAMFYSSHAEELRAFLGDNLGLNSVDIGAGWLVFDLPGAEVGVHAVDPEKSRLSGTQLISFYCDDLAATVADLAAKGVEFVGGIRQLDWGYATRLRAPGDLEIDLYQPRYGHLPSVPESPATE